MEVWDEVVLDFVVTKNNPEIDWGGREGIMAGGNWKGKSLIGVNITLGVAKICFEVIRI